MPTETPRLAEYLPHIGRLTIEAARLEELVLAYVIAFSDEPTDATRFKHMNSGLDAALNRLSELITTYVSTFYRQKVLDLIEKARQVKDKRNENVHGVWSELTDANTGSFVTVMRSRYNKIKVSKTTSWDLETPTIAELEDIGKELHDIVSDLDSILDRAWNQDEDVVEMRHKKGI